jgi:hypothetical protein
MLSLVVGEYGFPVVVETGLDLSGYSLSMEVRKPDGTQVRWNAIRSSQSPTKMQYGISQGDLDQPGVYVLHARVYKSGVERLGKAVAFLVCDKYERKQ